MELRIEHSLYAITNTDPNNQEREFITQFYGEIEDGELEELIERFVSTEIKKTAYYYVIEKQYYIE